MNQAQTAPPASPDSSTAPTGPVPLAANQCHPDATANGNTVLIVAEPSPTISVNASAAKTALTFASSERQWVGKCRQCGEMFTIKRPKNFKPKRFCNTRCRRKFFYEKNGR